MAGDTEIFEQIKQQPPIQHIIKHLSSYAGQFDPNAYINWELVLHEEFCKYDLSEEQKIVAASSVLLDYALTVWKHLCRHDIVPKTWNALKTILREYFVPEYYADYLLAKLQNLKQDSNTAETYYLELKVLMLKCGLIECEEAIENRFLRGLNTKIQDMLLYETYDSLSHLIQLASEIQIRIANGFCEQKVSGPFTTCEKKNSVDVMPFAVCSSVTNFGQDQKDTTAHTSKEDNEIGIHVSSTISRVNEDVHALIAIPYDSIDLVLNLEKSFVETSVDSPLSQPELVDVPCDKVDLCADASFTHMVNNCDTFCFEPYKCAEDKSVHSINHAQDELKLLSSLNTLGYIEFDIPCNLNFLKEKIKFDSNLPSFNHCSLHAIGKYDSKGEYLVNKVYICSNLKYPFGL